MTDASTRAPNAHPNNPRPTHSGTFDPADWLARYIALGGVYVANGKLNLCILVNNQTEEQLSQIREMVVALSEEDKAAILAHLKAAEAGPPMTWEGVVARFQADKAAADAHPCGRASPNDPAYEQMDREHGALLKAQCSSLAKVLATRAPTHAALLRKLGIIGSEYEIEDGIVGHLQADVAGLAKQTASDADPAILDAWERRRAAYGRYNALPHSEVPGEGYTPEEQREWGIIDAAEETIRAATAHTPVGVSVQLWVSLQHHLTKREDDEACLNRDIAAFDARDGDMDWTERLIVAALRSLKTMEG